MGKAARRKKETARARAAEPLAKEAKEAKETRQVKPLPRWLNLLGVPLAVVLLALFLVLKCYALHPQRVDEGIYFYEAMRLAEGARLYKELFFAHPPFQLFLPALLTRLFGYYFLVQKALPQLAGAAQGALAFVIARRALKSDLAGIVAMVALLFAEDFLKATSYATGINMADALLFGALAVALYRRPLTAGLLAGAATMTLLQTAPTAFVLGASIFLYDRRSGKRFAIGCGAMILLAHIIGIAYGGGDFFAEVYFYHLHKTVSEGAGEQVLGFLFADDLALFCGGTLAFALAFTSLDNRLETRRFVRALAIAAALQTVAMATRPKVFPFYFQPVFLPLALALGWAVSVALSRLRAAASGQARAVAMSLALSVLVLPILLTAPLTALVSPTRARQRETYTQSYRWKDAPGLGSLNPVVRWLLWSGGERAAGSWHNPATEYLWNLSRDFDSYPAIVEAVKRASPEGGTLFGDSGSVPLVALGAGRRVTADFADTNVQRFASGTTPPSVAIAKLEAVGGPTLILNSNNAGLFSLPEFRVYLEEHYAPLQQFADGNGTRYTLYRRAR